MPLYRYSNKQEDVTMQHSNIQKRYFTLVELMVAMGVLVIMMGFLFQFTIGAQRIWNASSKQTTSFSSAQVLMDVLNDDLQNMRYSNEEGETLPFYLYKEKDSDGIKKVTLAFYADFTSSTGIQASKTESQVGSYPVIYYFERGTSAAPWMKVHRCALDRDSYSLTNNNTKTLSNPELYLWRLCGADFSNGADYFNQLKETLLESSESLKLFDVLADNVHSFDVKVFFDSDCDFDPFSSDANKAKRYASVKPTAIKLQFELDSDNNQQTGEETKYSFSKVIFL